MAEERQDLSKNRENEVQEHIRILVDTMSQGAPEEIVANIQDQYVDRSAIYNNFKINPNNAEASKMAGYVETILKTMVNPIRKNLRLSYPPDSYSEDDPISQLYNAIYKYVSAWVTVIYMDEPTRTLFLNAMEKAGINRDNIDEFVSKEFTVLAYLQKLPEIAQIEKENPDYQDFDEREPLNYRYLDAKKKIEHTYGGKLVEKVSLENDGEELPDGTYQSLDIADEDKIKDVTVQLCMQQYAKFLSKKEKEVFLLRLQGYTLEEIAEKSSFHDASGVKKVINRIGKKLIEAGFINT